MSDNRFVGLYSSTARTSTPSPVVQANPLHRGLHVVIDVTAVSATPSVTPRIVGVGPTALDALGNPSAAADYILLEGTPITATGTTVLKLYPGIVAVANGAASDFLPYLWKVTMTHADTDSITYSVFAMLEG